ncbi:hypothetical protein JCM10908_005727 [Rhodotorula pacifica]|uniref:glycosyltransferase family 2 protein n=1 Tax=Rhodotorula pacifica TaxID=1495444 RepID=UPI003180D1DE
MNVPKASRRTAVLSLISLAALVLLIHATRSETALSSLSKGWRLAATKNGASYYDFLAHPTEEAALPLVSSIASFGRYRPAAEPVTVSICAIPTHEEQYLPEWLTWHRLIGVERFYLFDNSPSLEMRRLLRPWIEEGTVVLFELSYPEGTDIGSVYQQDALRMCESFVLPNTSWASHHDVDEFLMVDAPAWSSPIPTISAPSTRPPPSSTGVPAPALDWSYPLHERFRSLLDRATCVSLLRLPFQNYGLRQLGLDEFITDRQTVRDRVPANFHTYGKMFIHSAGNPARGGWMGPHSCKMPAGTVILDAHGKEFRFERGSYPYDGLPLPQEGLYLFHYVQRSLEDCERKFHVVSGTAHDWRTRDGLDGCARNYVPIDEEINNASRRTALEALPRGDLLVQRPDGWRQIFMRDTSARDSWQGRMTRAVLTDWRSRGGERLEEGWFWEHGDEASEERLKRLAGIYVIRDVRRATLPNAVLSDVSV